MMGTPEKMFPFVLFMFIDVQRCSVMFNRCSKMLHYLLVILSFGFVICANGENLS